MLSRILLVAIHSNSSTPSPAIAMEKHSHRPEGYELSGCPQLNEGFDGDIHSRACGSVKASHIAGCRYVLSGCTRMLANTISWSSRRILWPF